MLRLKKHPKRDDEYLALPGAEPVTLYEFPSKNLPYACQCPLCGGLFNIPESTVYKLEDDDYEDVDSETEPKGPGRGPGLMEEAGNEFSEEANTQTERTAPEETGGEEA